MTPSAALDKLDRIQIAQTLDAYLAANELPACAADDEPWQAGLRRYLTICWNNGIVGKPSLGPVCVVSSTHTGFGSGGWG